MVRVEENALLFHSTQRHQHGRNQHSRYGGHGNHTSGWRFLGVPKSPEYLGIATHDLRLGERQAGLGRPGWDMQGNVYLGDQRAVEGFRERWRYMARGAR